MPRSTHNCPKTKSAIVDGHLITGCPACLHTVQGSATYAAKWKRDRQREDYRQDIIQRYDGDKLNPEWVKKYTKRAIDELGEDTVTEILRK